MAAMSPEIPLSFGQSVRETRTAGFRLLETRHPQGMVLPLHQHPHACVNVVLEGCYREDYGRSAGEFGALTCYYKPAGEPHSNRFPDASSRCLLIEITDEGIFPHELDLGRTAVSRSPRAAHAGLAIWHELADPDACTELAVEELALEVVEDTLGERERALLGSARVRAACDALHDDPRRPWTLSALARHVGLHPSHLARAFRTRHGCTIGEYLRRLRLNEVARALALGERPISDLALEQGFADQSHCTRAFRRQFGTTPAAFRRVFR